MAVNLHMVPLSPHVNLQNNNIDSVNGNEKAPSELLRPNKDLQIDPKFVISMSYNNTIIINSKHNQVRVMTIDDCKSFDDGLNLIISKNFLKYFKSLPYAFMIVLKCSESMFKENRCVEVDLKRHYKSKRPLIVAFETYGSYEIFYKNFGDHEKFIRVLPKEPNDYSIPVVRDFRSLILNLEDSEYGYFNGSFDYIVLYRKLKSESKFEKSIEELMEIFADLGDFLCIRFLHLFDPDLRPSKNRIINILKEDFELIQLDGFCTVFDYYMSECESRYPDHVYSQKNVDSHLNLILKSSFSGQENLLMLAVRCRNIEVVDLLLSCGFNVNLTNEKFEMAVDMAYELKQYDIMTMLLEANSRFPRCFNMPSKPPQKLLELIYWTKHLHDLITYIPENGQTGALDASAKNEISNVISKYPQLDYWYSSTNESAAAKSIKCKKFYTYNVLLHKGLFVGPSEDLKSIKENLSILEQDKIRQINVECATPIPKDYLLVLRLNSFMWQNRKHEKPPPNLIEDAFNILDENELVRPILQIVAAAPNFRIIFDFNHTSVEALDLTSNDTTNAVFYLNLSHIYIGAKDLLDENKKFETIGTLAHELCHFAMLLTYGNLCNPYNVNDLQRREIFTQIHCEISRLKIYEYLIELVYKYNANRHNAELIVRVPQLLIHYARDNLKLQELQEIFIKLFEYYKIYVVEDMKNQVTNVSERYCENIKFEHEFWEKKIQKEKIVRFVLIISLIITFGLIFLLSWWLLSIEPCFILSIPCSWDKLLNSTKEQLLNRNCKLNGIGNYTLRHCTQDNEEALRALTDDQIKSLEPFSINDQNLHLDFEYFERYVTFFTATYAYHNIEKDGNILYYSEDVIKTIQSIQSDLKSPKIYLFSGDPVSGITTIFLHIAMALIRNNTLKWITYLDFKEFTKFGNIKNKLFQERYRIKGNWTFENITEFLIDAHEAKFSKIEREIFKCNVKNGNVILFIDHIDAIFMNNEDLAQNFLKSLMKYIHNEAEIWIGTKSWYGVEIEKIINKRDPNYSSHYKLLPIYGRNLTKFLEKKINESQELTPTQIKLTMIKIKEFLNITEIWRDSQDHGFDNICLLQIMVNHTIKSIKQNDTHVNMYKIIDQYVLEIMAFKFWQDDKKTKNSTINERLSLDKALQAVVLWTIKLKYNFKKHNIDMQAMIKDISMSVPNFNIIGPNGSLYDMSSSQIQTLLKIGILKVVHGKLKFLDVTNFEYFTAMYIIEEIFMKIKEQDPTTYLYRHKLLLLFGIYYDDHFQFPVVQRCIEDFLRENQKNSETKFVYKESFRKAFKEILSDFITATNDTSINVGRNMKSVFEDDDEMLRILD